MKLILKLYPDITCSQNQLSIILIDIVVYSVLKLFDSNWTSTLLSLEHD